MKVEWEGLHPDEGSIHAWLDGELDAVEAALLDEHVHGCTACVARVAEARGLMAGASRVVGQLDAAPARLIQPATTPTLGDNGRLWRLMRVTPARASIAAVLLVGLGLTLTRSRAARESEVAMLARTPSADTSAIVAMAAPKEESVVRPDGLLDSAISRKLAGEQPARTVQRAPGATIPSQDAPMIASAPPDTTASMRVAAARASIRARADSATPPADRARVGQTPSNATTADILSSAGRAAEVAGFSSQLAGRVPGVVVGSSIAGTCYLVESTVPGAQWGTATLPMVLAFDSTGTTARVLTTNGADTEMRATRARSSGDSLVLRLRRIGYTGSLTLDAIGGARGGVMRSSQSTLQLESVVVTSANDARRDSARSEPRVAALQPRAGAPAAPSPVVAKAEAKRAENVSSAGAAVSITAHVVSCSRR